MNHMYDACVGRLNVLVGCIFKCIYCPPAFQSFLKRFFAKCDGCRTFQPHIHLERLEKKLSRTKEGKFIFVSSTGDISQCPSSVLDKILNVIRANSDSNFLIQSKNPGALKSISFPENVFLGTTLETNRIKEYTGVSLAPLPEQRFKDLLAINHPKKTITVEPIIEFDTEIMKEWIRAVKPVMVWVGYDSHKSGLIEPATAKVQQFIEDLRAEGFNVIEKLIRAPHPLPGSVVPRFTRTVIARGSDWSAAAHGPIDGYDILSAAKSKFHELCEKLGYSEICWCPQTSEVTGYHGKDYGDIDLEAVLTEACESIDYSTLELEENDETE